ncbi:hypothetical protein SESBI_34533 [Sesbania bispinosa]|nr:hypothetical protein SESBI_34533 [Sesbania bispinosa]
MAMLTRILGCTLLVLLLTAGSETRSLSPTIVSNYMLQNSNRAPIQAEAVAGYLIGDNKYDAERLSPEGPDSHHHYIKS